MSGPTLAVAPSSDCWRSRLSSCWLAGTGWAPRYTRDGGGTPGVDARGPIWGTKKFHRYGGPELTKDAWLPAPSTGGGRPKSGCVGCCACCGCDGETPGSKVTGAVAPLRGCPFGKGGSGGKFRWLLLLLLPIACTNICGWWYQGGFSSRGLLPWDVICC